MVKPSSEVFYKRIRHIGAVVVGDARGLAFNVFHQSVEVVARIGDADYPNGGAVPQAAGLEFSDGNIEAATQTIFQAAQHLPLVLE